MTAGGILAAAFAAVVLAAATSPQALGAALVLIPAALVPLFVLAIVAGSIRNGG
jgi:hypothetical protein